MSQASANLSSTGGDTPAAAKSDRFPAGIPYIVGNEGAERFSFYGMRQILYVYLTALFTGFVAENVVDVSALADAKVRATQWTHQFMAAVYLVPMIGAIFADRLFGKYKVIFWVSLIYVAGHGVLAFGGRAGAMGQFGAAEVMMLIGLALIATGSGGIKPCVSANVGDQFTKENGHLVGRIFQIFYFIINFGSFFASIITPLLYKKVNAEVAFGVPGILMALAAIVFWMGRKKFVKVPPKPGGALGAFDAFASLLMFLPLAVIVAFGAEMAEHVVKAGMGEVEGGVGGALGHIAATYWPHFLGSVVAFGLGLVMFGIRQRRQQDTGFLATLLYCWQHRSERAAGEDFWSPARKTFGEEAADGPPAVLRIILVFSMVSVFWALFDQHSSTWVEQAKHMNLVLEMPGTVWALLVTGTLGGAIFGLVWLMLWVSNRRPQGGLLYGLLGGGLVLGVVLARILLGENFLSPETMHLEMLASQISAMNPLMVMIIIPALSLGVYGPLERAGRPLKPLVRMTIGMFMAGVSFALAALLQAKMEGAPDGTMHVLWQTPQYLLITTAEVLVSVTGLEFAYTQAPRSMKSTIMGFWLLCVTFGNILVAFLAPLQKLSLSTFFWVFVAIMTVAAVIFAVLAYFYKGKTYLQEASGH